MEDIATLPVAQPSPPRSALKLDQIGLEVLGQARRVVITKDNTTIVDGSGKMPPPSRARLPDQGRDREHRLRLGPRELQEAGSRHSPAGVCIIKVGAATEVVLAEGEEAPHRGRRRRPARPSRRATPRAARADPRCGRASTGSASPVTRRPASGWSGSPSTSRCGSAERRRQPTSTTRSGELGVRATRNAATEEYGDLVAQGVLDPVKVTRFRPRLYECQLYRGNAADDRDPGPEAGGRRARGSRPRPLGHGHRGPKALAEPTNATPLKRAGGVDRPQLEAGAVAVRLRVARSTPR